MPSRNFHNSNRRELWHDKHITAQAVAAVRIDRPPYFVDIVEDAHTEPPIWHCIVQRCGSSSVIAWFQESSEQAARQSAETELHNLKLQDLKRSGQLPLQLNPDPDQAA